MLQRFIAIVLLAIGLAAAAHAQPAPTRYQLTLAGLQKYESATKELGPLLKSKDEKDIGKGGMTVDVYSRELDATPGVKPILARHGFTTREYAATAAALFEGLMHLMLEPMMDKSKIAETLASYPPETRANIELLRKAQKAR